MNHSDNIAITATNQDVWYAYFLSFNYFLFSIFYLKEFRYSVIITYLIFSV
jgi:hypothetical protein